jgi:hypothetical protein
VGDPERRRADGGALQRLADELRVADGTGGDGGDVRPELGDDVDEPLVAQAHERLAHGRAAHAQRGGELVLRQPPAGLQLGADDRVAEVRVHAGARGALAAALGQ